MNVKKFVPLIAAVLLGFIAMMVARKALNKTSTADASNPVVGVAVATRDMPPGRALSADDLTVSPLPAESLPSGSFRTIQELLGRTTLQPMVKGQAVVEQMLAPTGAKGGLIGLIPKGHRAMTVEVNEFSGLAGMLEPGARVDVVTSLRDEKGVQLARTILQNLEVRAVGRNINPAPVAEGAPPPPPTNNVTVLVTPRQAQILNLATQNGRPWLVLRNNLDKEMPESELVTLAELTAATHDTDEHAEGSVARPTTMPAVTVSDVFAPPARPAARVVQVIRGGVESTVKFEVESRPTLAAPATRPSTDPEFNGHAVTDADTGSATE